jgi:hypothetical protein
MQSAGRESAAKLVFPDSAATTKLVSKEYRKGFDLFG